MDIRKLSLHKIDITKNTAEKIEIDIKKETIIEYVNNLVDEILDSPNKRMYRFKNGETQVKSSLDKLVKDDVEVEKILLHNAERLLEKEVHAHAQLKLKNLSVNIQKGSLLHLHFVQEGISKVLICKVEHDEYLNELSFDKNNGLNTKKKVFKSFLLFLDTGHIYLNDKNNSKYWWDDFLELNQLNTDDKNTETSLHEIDKVLTAYKTKYYADYLIVRNALIGHYRSREDFNFTTMVDDVFTKYTPISIDFPKDKIINRIVALPDSKGFDTQFTISKKDINKRIKTHIKLSNNLYLNINDYVEDLKNIIEPVEEHGAKYIKILSTEGYETLKALLKK
ncbi:hypothetical protein [Flavobacterium sp. LAR06]|uniref:hypothetical protein n=1 Tax=Flavobacterium sp. LAR06 TaxID=3064897 RepID=UPI0035BEDAC4